MLRRRVQTPVPSGHSKREQAEATVDEKDAVQSRADESPASLPPPAASLIGSDVRCKAGRAVPKRGRPSSRSATRQSRVAQRASRRPPNAPFENRRGRGTFSLSPFQGEMQRGFAGMPAKGRETSRGADRRLLLSAAGGRLQPERSPRGRIQGGGELRTAYPSAAPNSMPAVWRRGPRLVNVASGLAHRSAQHLTPLRGRPLRTEAAMEREGAEVLVQGPTLEARASSYGPEDPAPPDLPQGRPGGKLPRRGGHTHTPEQPSSRPITKISVISGSNTPSPHSPG